MPVWLKHKQGRIEKMANEKRVGAWIDQESAVLIDKYRATRMPVPSKYDALRDLIEIGWKAVERKMKKKEQK
jgi:hypothetical protein